MNAGRPALHAPGGIAYPDIPGVRVWLLHEDMKVSIELDRSPLTLASQDFEDRVEAQWQRRLKANPKMFNAPLLAVSSFDPLTGAIKGRVEEYRRMVVQPEVDTGVVLLAVTVVLLGTDAQGRKCVILGKRSPKTRIYGNYWELGPSGGVELPPDNVTFLGESYIFEQCALEMEHELNVPWRNPYLCAVTYERDAQCLDLIVSADVDIPAGGLSPSNWEYLEVRAVPIEDLPAFDQANAANIIPPTRALWRFWGWV